jgi:hypothetical protein
MSAVSHQAAIHWLAAHLPADPEQRREVERLIRDHEAACVAEDGNDPACPPCQFGHRCQRGSGCPIRKEAGNA